MELRCRSAAAQKLHRRALDASSVNASNHQRNAMQYHTAHCDAHCNAALECSFLPWSKLQPWCLIPFPTLLQTVHCRLPSYQPTEVAHKVPTRSNPACPFSFRILLLLSLCASWSVRPEASHTVPVRGPDRFESWRGRFGQAKWTSEGVAWHQPLVQRGTIQADSSLNSSRPWG